jgi:hypothetical protein
MIDVSVLMSVYNGEQFLAEAMESVLTQTLGDFELIVIDDGSTDGSSEILERYRADDSRVVIHTQPNQGRAAALNTGIALSRAPLIARLDADDIAMPDRLGLQHRFLAEHTDLAVVGGAVVFIDDAGRAFADVTYPPTDAAIRASLAERMTPFVHSAVMVRKEALERVGGYRSVFINADDIDLWLRTAEHYRLANLTETVVRYRVHRSQATVRSLQMQSLCCVAAYTAARARAVGGPDPFDSIDRIDEQNVILHGATPEEIAAMFVRSATWMAKTTDRAGYADLADALFAQADATARAPSGSRALVASVHRARAQQYAAHGSKRRAKLAMVRAAIAERRRSAPLNP